MTFEPAICCARAKRVGMAHTLSIACLFSSFHWSDWASRSSVVWASVIASLNCSSWTWDRFQPPASVNSGGTIVEAFGQSRTQAAHISSPDRSGSKMVE